jgi:hypothetical protein
MNQYRRYYEELRRGGICKSGSREEAGKSKKSYPQIPQIFTDYKSNSKGERE